MTQLNNEAIVKSLDVVIAKAAAWDQAHNRAVLNGGLTLHEFDVLAAEHRIQENASKATKPWPSQYESDVMLPDGTVHSERGQFPPTITE